MRKQILEAFGKGAIQTRAAYIALEHEWMHLETLAYMLAQAQRLSFERSSPTANGHMSHQKENGDMISDSSSEDEVLNERQPANGHGMRRLDDHANGAIRASANSHSNGDSNGAVNGLASASNGVASGHHGVTNGTNGHMCLSKVHVTPPVSMLTVPAGDITLGTDTDPTRNFVWDNEGPRQSPQHVSSFQMATHPVSNADFYRFAVACSGYEEEQYWTAADLACLKKRKQHCPATWTVQVIAFTIRVLAHLAEPISTIWASIQPNFACLLVFWLPTGKQAVCVVLTMSGTLQAVCPALCMLSLVSSSMLEHLCLIIAVLKFSQTVLLS